jgi:chorismate mutase / prephenate dehydratase
MENMSLLALRQQIDSIDAKLVQLLNERARVSLNIGKIKKERGRFVKENL